MPSISLLLLSFLLRQAEPLGPGDHSRSLSQGETKRTYLVHVPPGYDSKKPTPVVLVFHGAGMNGRMMAWFCEMNKKSDQANFIAVYPDGTGVGTFLTWNAFGGNAKFGKNRADDVGFVNQLIDDLAQVVNVDPKRVYATGISNGGMMSYKLAAELSNRIAAVAPVAGTLTLDQVAPNRPVPILHFHGTEDTLVPFNGPKKKLPGFMNLRSVEESVQAWVEANGCPKEPKVIEEPDQVKDGTKVVRKVFGPGKNDAEVVLYVIEGGGHTWPGVQAPIGLIGRSTREISANDLIWEFFQKHPMK